MLDRTKWIALLASVLMVAPTLRAQDMSAQRIQDISLGTGGLLNGKIVGPNGAAMPNEVVTVANSNGNQVRVKTDNQGYFGVRGLPGGTFSVTSRHGTQWIRGWAPGTAPQGAKAECVVVGNPVMAASGSAVQPAGHFAPGCDTGCDTGCDAGCAVGGAGALAGNKAVRFVGGAALIGLGVWGIVELADDDDAATP